MKLLLSHIADLDGVTPVILMNLLKEDFDYELFEIGEIDKFILDRIDSDYFDKYNQIFITDLGITKECVEKIVNSKYNGRFKIFDHHESHYYLNEYNFATVIEEVNGFKECGTTLFYNYLVNNYESTILKKDSVINFVELVRENDTWQFTELKEDSMNLTALFSFYGRDTYIETYTNFLGNNKKFYFTETELIILKSLNNEKQNYLESMKDKVLFRNINGYNVGIVFAERYRSELGHYIAEMYKDKIDFVCIINLTRHISLRGIKNDKPVNKFAEIYGGGGHPLAAAMPYPIDLKQKIIDYIFGDYNENK